VVKKKVDPVMKTVVVQLRVDVEIDIRGNIWDQLRPYFVEKLGEDANPREYSIIS
jgi:hypothetical protein